MPWTGRLPVVFQRLAGLGVDVEERDDMRLEREDPWDWSLT